MACYGGWGHTWWYLGSDPFWGTKFWKCSKCGARDET